MLLRGGRSSLSVYSLFSAGRGHCHIDNNLNIKKTNNLSSFSKAICEGSFPWSLDDNHQGKCMFETIFVTGQKFSFNKISVDTDIATRRTSS